MNSSLEAASSEESIDSKDDEDNNSTSVNEKLYAEAAALEATPEFVCPDIEHGQPVSDRKSTFQGHLARVTDKKEVNISSSNLVTTLT